MTNYRTKNGETQDIKVNNKNVARDLLDARGQLAGVWLTNKPSTDEETAIWVRVGIALEQIQVAAELLRKQ